MSRFAHYAMAPGQLAKRLWELGWLGSRFRKGHPRELEQALRAYQEWAGLVVDGWAGPVTARSLEAPRFCALPDCLEMSADILKWPIVDLTWTVTGQLPHITAEDQKGAFEAAWRRWAEVCGVRPSYTTNKKTAHVLMGAGPIDRGGATLAWSEMPRGVPIQLKQKFDTYEVWSTSQPIERFKIDLVRVACHELGHVLGIPHLGSGNLMQPSYDIQIDSPQQGDIKEAVLRYGPGPDSQKLSQLEPLPKLILEVEGDIRNLSIPGFRVERIVS